MSEEIEKRMVSLEGRKWYDELRLSQFDRRLFLLTAVVGALVAMWLAGAVVMSLVVAREVNRPYGLGSGRLGGG